MQISSLPTLENTVNWMVPVIRYLQSVDVPNPPWQKRLPYRHLTQPLVITLTDEPIKSVSKVMALYAQRERQFAEALTNELGDDWLVQPVQDHNQNGRYWTQSLNYIGGQVEEQDVIIAPERTAFIYDQAHGKITPGKSKKSGVQFRIWLHARRFASASDKTAYLICK